MIHLNKHDFDFSDSSDSDEYHFPDTSIFRKESVTKSNPGHSLNSTRSSLLSNRQILIGHKSGWLQKKAENILKAWQSRFFVLSDDKLEYYQRESEQKPSGTINFAQVDILIKLTSSCLRIKIKGINDKMYLKSSSHSELEDWARAIQRVIDCNIGKKKELPKVSVGEKFWKYEKVSEYYFSSSTSTGDILLFRSKDLSSKIQRGLTRSKYDHVAMVLCYSSGRIMLLEATQFQGVSLTDWSDFLYNKWQDLYEAIAFRSLIFERNDENLIKLDKFVHKVKGKNYGLGPAKLLGRGSFRAPGDEKDFFCSELVASAYKALGIMNEKIPSRNFMPGSFVDDRVLGLINAKLGPIKLINF